MFYSPHTLYKKKVGEIRVDGLGKPSAPAEEWVEVGVCRCDDDTTQELKSQNGQTYRSRYHVVYDKTDLVKEGEEIRCVDSEGRIRGDGIVGMVKNTNYLGYSELWT